jgi:hypothetical protein
MENIKLPEKGDCLLASILLTHRKIMSSFWGRVVGETGFGETGVRWGLISMDRSSQRYETIDYWTVLYRMFEMLI